MKDPDLLEDQWSHKRIAAKTFVSLLYHMFDHTVFDLN